MQLVIDISPKDYNFIKSIISLNLGRAKHKNIQARIIYAIKDAKILPKHHGKIIDTNNIGLTDFEIVMCSGDYKQGLQMICEKIDNAPTILEGTE